MKRALIITAVVIIIVGIIVAYTPIKNILSKDKVYEDNETETIKPIGPTFSQDSAYAMINAQCNFGPRPMNTTQHEACGEWIAKQFKKYGCSVTLQKAILEAYNGEKLRATNIIASYKPERKKRIIIAAHWDTRPWADNDPDSANWKKPILAANDAASGVAVMIEIARLLKQKNDPKIGIDFVCFDAEDYGTPQWDKTQYNNDGWALGANYLAQNIPNINMPEYAILLDMVGGQGAKFYKEGVSMQYAPDIVNKVWKAARQAGYADFFIEQDGGMITDDHVPMNEIAHIKTIDIIPYYPDCTQSAFGPTWHTINDNMQYIDKNTLKAVGQTIIQVIFTENI